MIAAMDPQLLPGRFVFVTVGDDAATLSPLALGSFRETEGLSLILAEADAPADADAGAMPMRCITLNVHSALDGVGLTAAVSGALAECDIPANIVAAYHHDHVFVPAGMADEALAVLRKLQAG
ncbi:ACT domain-containing protein [Sphingomonadaceae bacterium LXI357]|uniref:ACT domain-containing protein n=2 Tax=Stakelama marina TaxID=2826939 RepID=A0A8T4IKF6_9SPHN|nr:ACT domain-containing protein [Stakelama marina]